MWVTQDHTRLLDEKAWPGQNILGVILMETRGQSKDVIIYKYNMQMFMYCTKAIVLIVLIIFDHSVYIMNDLIPDYYIGQTAKRCITGWYFA